MAQPTAQTCKYNHTVQTAIAQRTILASHLSQLNMAKWYCLNPELYNSLKKTCQQLTTPPSKLAHHFPLQNPFPSLRFSTIFRDKAGVHCWKALAELGSDKHDTSIHGRLMMMMMMMNIIIIFLYNVLLSFLQCILMLILAHCLLEIDGYVLCIVAGTGMNCPEPSGLRLAPKKFALQQYPNPSSSSPDHYASVPMCVSLVVMIYFTKSDCGPKGPIKTTTKFIMFLEEPSVEPLLNRR